MCDLHGGAAPQVRRSAAERLIMTADQVAQLLVKMMEDTEMPFGVRAKIAQDFLDRASLASTQAIKIVPAEEDAVMRSFSGLLDDSSALVSTQPDPTPAIESYATSSRDRHDVLPEESALWCSSHQVPTNLTTPLEPYTHALARDRAR